MTSFILTLMPCTALSAEFEAIWVQSGPGINKGEGRVKFYVKGTKWRQDRGKAVVVGDSATGKAFVLDPAKKTSMPMPGMMGAGQQQDIDGFKKAFEAMGGSVTKVGSEKISGYLCDKYETKSKFSPEPGHAWYSKELKMMLKTASSFRGVESKAEMTNIKKRKLADSLFEVPADYTVMTMEQMMQDDDDEDEDEGDDDEDK